MGNRLPGPPETVMQAYETCVASLRLVDALNTAEGLPGREDAHTAASMALRASLAAFLVLTCPGGEQAYYVAAATELYEDMFTQGRGVAESLGVFLSLGWQHTDGIRPGHDPYTEADRDGRPRGACTCGYHGPTRSGLPKAQEDALDHAQYPVIEPIMLVPTG